MGSEQKSDGEDPPHPPSVVSMGISEAKELERLQAERIGNLNERAQTLFTYLFGGTSVFTGLTALLSFFKFGESSSRAVGVTFYRYLGQSHYFQFGLVFFFTSLLFAFLATAPYRYRRGVDDKDLSHVRYGQITENAQWQREVLETQIQNLRANSRTIGIKVHMIFGSILTVLFAFALLAIGLLNAVSHLRFRGGVYRIKEQLINSPTYPIPILTLFLVFFFVLLIAYFSIRVRITPWDPDEEIVDLSYSTLDNKDRGQYIPDWENAFEILPFAIIIIELVGILVFGRYLWMILAIILGVVVSLVLYVVVALIHDKLNKKTFKIKEYQNGNGSKLKLQNNTSSDLDLGRWTIEKCQSGEQAGKLYTVPNGTKLSSNGLLTIEITNQSTENRGETGQPNGGVYMDMNVSTEDFTSRHVISRILIRNERGEIIQKFWLMGATT